MLNRVWVLSVQSLEGTPSPLLSLPAILSWLVPFWRLKPSAGTIKRKESGPLAIFAGDTEGAGGVKDPHVAPSGRPSLCSSAPLGRDEAVFSKGLTTPALVLHPPTAGFINMRLLLPTQLTIFLVSVSS